MGLRTISIFKKYISFRIYENSVNFWNLCWLVIWEKYCDMLINIFTKWQYIINTKCKNRKLYWWWMFHFGISVSGCKIYNLWNKNSKFLNEARKTRTQSWFFLYILSSIKYRICVARQRPPGVPSKFWRKWNLFVVFHILYWGLGRSYNSRYTLL